MDEIEKILRAMSAKDRQKVRAVASQILSGDLSGLLPKKIGPHLYRIRVGQFRIIYAHKNDQVMICAIRRRNEKTYKGL